MALIKSLYPCVSKRNTDQYITKSRRHLFVTATASESQNKSLSQASHLASAHYGPPAAAAAASPPPPSIIPPFIFCRVISLNQGAPWQPFLTGMTFEAGVVSDNGSGSAWSPGDMAPNKIPCHI